MQDLLVWQKWKDWIKSMSFKLYSSELRADCMNVPLLRRNLHHLQAGTIVVVLLYISEFNERFNFTNSAYETLANEQKKEVVL
jgi:hypothetical protein